MDFKEIFKDKPLTLAEFETAIKGKNLVDLSEGGYVPKDTADTQGQSAKDWKKKYTDLSKSIDGDDGLKKQIETLTAEKETATQKITEYETKAKTAKQTSLLKKMGIDDKFSKFALNEINSLVSDSVDFETASKKWVSENEQFVSTTPPANGFSFSTPNGTNTTVNDKDGNSNNLLNSALRTALS